MQTHSLAAQAQALHCQTARHACPALQPTPPCAAKPRCTTKLRWGSARPRLQAPAVEKLMRAQEQVQLPVGPGGRVQEHAVAGGCDAARVTQESPAVQVLQACLGPARPEGTRGTAGLSWVRGSGAQRGCRALPLRGAAMPAGRRCQSRPISDSAYKGSRARQAQGGRSTRQQRVPYAGAAG